jgi:hypothetical protein
LKKNNSPLVVTFDDLFDDICISGTEVKQSESNGKIEEICITLESYKIP